MSILVVLILEFSCVYELDSGIIEYSEKWDREIDAFSDFSVLTAFGTIVFIVEYTTIILHRSKMVCN